MDCYCHCVHAIAALILHIIENPHWYLCILSAVCCCCATAAAVSSVVPEVAVQVTARCRILKSRSNSSSAAIVCGTYEAWKCDKISMIKTIETSFRFVYGSILNASVS